MKVVIVYKGRSGKTTNTVEFSGCADYAVQQGMQFIYNNQPITVVAVRYEPEVTKELSEGLSWKDWEGS